MPGETITLTAKVQTSDGLTQTVASGNVTFKVNGSAISGNTYLIPTGAGATFSIDVDLKPGVIITIDGISYVEADLPSTPKTVYVATGLELTGTTTVNHYGTYSYVVKKVFSDTTKTTITGNFAWTLGAVSLGNSTGTISIPTSVPPGTRTLTATINGRSGSLNLTVNAVNTSLTIAGPTTAYESATTPGYTIRLNKSDGTSTIVNTLASVSVPGGSWIAGTNVAGGASIIAPAAPGLTAANPWMYISITASYAGFNASLQVGITYLPPTIYTNADMFTVVSLVDITIEVSVSLTDGRMWQSGGYGFNGQQFFPPGTAPGAWGYQSAAHFTIPSLQLSRYNTVSVSVVDFYTRSPIPTAVLQQPTAANGWVAIIQQNDPPSAASPVGSTVRITTT